MPDSILTSYPLDRLPPELQRGVVAIGNFDGVHRGHGELIRATVAEARRLRAPAVILTFEPHPRTFFQPETPVFRLTPLPAKGRLLTALGLDGLAFANFDAAFAAQTPDVFAEAVLGARLEAVATVVGHDFRYGKGRRGNAESLKGEGARLGFSVEVIGEIADEAGRALSSSAIRDALAAGEIAEANRLLGYRWFVIGEVIGGERRGHELGYPTANIRLAPECQLRHGIYAVNVGRAGQTIGGVANFGRRPTFDNGAPLLEVFLFDFSGDLYGEVLTVTFLDWIRPELRFDRVADLVAAIGKDVEAARAIVAGAAAGNRLDRRLARLSGAVVPGESIS